MLVSIAHMRHLADPTRPKLAEMHRFRFFLIEVVLLLVLVLVWLAVALHSVRARPRNSTKTS